MRKDQDFGFYGKGLDGYVHYRQAMREAGEHRVNYQTKNTAYQPPRYDPDQYSQTMQQLEETRRNNMRKSRRLLGKTAVLVILVIGMVICSNVWPKAMGPLIVLTIADLAWLGAELK